MRSRSLKLATFLTLAAPAAWAVVAVYRELQAPGSVLGADPGEALVHHFGEWALIVLLAALCVSTLARRARFAGLLAVRRMVGLFAFGYATLHISAYVALLAGFSLAQLAEDLTGRAYIIAGFAAWCILLALAVTSTGGWQRRLRRRWKLLHRGVYLGVALALLHLFWLTRSDYQEAVLFSGVFAILLLERWFAARRNA